LVTDKIPHSGREYLLAVTRRGFGWWPSNWVPFVSSIRLRLVAWFVLVLGVATIASIVVVDEIALRGVEERIDEDLVQEARELRKLAGGVDPDTGKPFSGNVRRIFDVYLERNVPSENEALLTFVDGEPFRRSRAVVPYRLDRDRELVALWGDLNDSRRGQVETPEGEVDYLAVPIREKGETKGVFVVAAFSSRERAESDTGVTDHPIGLIVLVIGSLLAWRLADKILTPVESVTETALSISETDLTRRIDVRRRDEIGRLATAFNEMLDRLEGAFGEQKRFIDDAGHELRTPMTIIRGQLEFLEDDPKKREKTIAIVMDELDRMSRFVTDLLLLASSEHPGFLAFSTVEVKELTEELHRKASSLARREWRLEAAARGRIVADRQRLTQAIMQIAQNATQFTNEGDVITLGSAMQNGEARFWVKDQGPGIHPEDQQLIFDRFRRLGHRRRDGGAGLGLSIVEAIVKAHNGRVEVFSRPGQGAVFTLAVPVDQPVSVTGGER
jgi:signal transduction histidine kinase